MALQACSELMYGPTFSIIGFSNDGFQMHVTSLNLNIWQIKTFSELINYNYRETLSVYLQSF